jgi:hypothetical protein
MKWACGVTTVASRRDDLLPRTLKSLAIAGFDQPRLFIDGAKDSESWTTEFGLETTTRWPAVKTCGNWMLGLAELYYRNPTADRFIMFQDDVVAVQGLREYLERSEMNDESYLNLYTHEKNDWLANERKITKGWFTSNQLGKGALGLAFTLKVVITLLTSQHMAWRPTDPVKGQKSLDGGIVTSMTKAGIEERCHQPSLLQHTGLISSMSTLVHPLAPNFPGEKFNAMEWFK